MKQQHAKILNRKF